MEEQLNLYGELYREDTVDSVNSPSHYTSSNKIECIDAIMEATGDGYEYYLQGVILKYLWRYRYKGKPVEDLQKAEWYLKKLIEITQDAEAKEQSSN
tara:strand:- start:231 stop:521 length:291 start_codon:yes stop_codon:yes gene_type:complete